MNSLQHILRIPRSRGFGVQSPADYHFLRHVIRQRMPYYAYEALESITTHLSKREIDILRFYLRLANYVQDRYPIYIIGKDLFGNIDNDLRIKFMTAGSKKVCVKHASRIPKSLNEDTTSVLVIENLAYNKEAVKDTKLAKVLFDMQDIAVVFCAPNRHKAIYKVNL